MGVLENIVSAVLPYAPHAMVRQDDNGELVVCLAMRMDAQTGDAVPLDDGEDVFDE